MDTVKIAVVGCEPGYLKNLTGLFAGIEVLAVCDGDYSAAEEAARRHGIPKVYAEPREIFDNPAVQIVVNLAPPHKRSAVTRAALEAGKHVFSGSPPAASHEEAKALDKLAGQNSLMFGCAPDVFLGASLQTCRKLLDDGYIGAPSGASVAVSGPVLDVLTSLVCLLGPAVRVSGATHASYVTGVLEFQYGTAATFSKKIETQTSEAPYMEIYGVEGTLSLSDPSLCGGVVRLARCGGGFYEMPLTHGYAGDSRGIGVADMARALRSGTPHRASGVLACHVLELAEGLMSSSKGGRTVAVKSTCLRPEIMERARPERDTIL